MPRELAGSEMRGCALVAHDAAPGSRAPEGTTETASGAAEEVHRDREPAVWVRARPPERASEPWAMRGRIEIVP